jgi:RNA polymerase sigma-70 factor (ECF subfamily)
VASPSEDATHWLALARTGSAEALGQVLEACRGYLLLVAQRELDPQLGAKGGVSDLVQETLLDAVRDFPRFQGNSEAELLAWLRRVLLNNLVSFTRRYRAAGKRAVGREVALDGDHSSAERGGLLAADAPSPSAAAMDQEQAAAIQQALERLPEDYRRVIDLRYREERSFEEIGQLLGLTANASRKLWLRAVKRLQQETDTPPLSGDPTGE